MRTHPKGTDVERDHLEPPVSQVMKMCEGQEIFHVITERFDCQQFGWPFLYSCLDCLTKPD